MAVVTATETKGSEGVRKRIDPTAMMMLIDGQQAKQYKEPEKSAVREVVSNAIDAISEKNKALKILSGLAKPEDFYARRMDPMLKDSNFFIEYYEEKYLSKDKNNVLITHKYNSTGKDILKIKDWGVGIGFCKHPDTGKTRLEGVLEIGYSTKRNTNTELGKWGIGAKSPLAIGSETGYLMETIHNGKRFLIRIFDFNYHSMIGKLNKNGKNNPFVLFYEGTEDETAIYYEETEEVNQTEITIEVSPSQRSLFMKAVKDQLQYFDNIDFVVIEEDGTKVEHDVEVEKLYEGETFIIPKTSDFRNPHLILNKVNYGLINYGAMEVEQRKGCLAMKIDPSSVEVDRSRESLIWNQKTREAVIDFHKKVETEAYQVLLDQFKIDNYAEWLESCTAFISSKGGGLKAGNIAGVLSQFLEGYEVNSKSLFHHSGLGHFDVFRSSFQWVQTSNYTPRLLKGNESKSLEELGLSLQYTNSADSYSMSKILDGVPVVLRVLRGTDQYDPPPISAAEKFSILKHLRDVTGDLNLGAFYISSLAENSNEHVRTFLKDMKTASFKMFDIYDFDIASKAYKINIDSGESALTSEEERRKAEAEQRRREREKHRRDNKIFNYFKISASNGIGSATGLKQEGNADRIIQSANGDVILYGRSIERNISETWEEDDLQYAYLLKGLMNKSNNTAIFCTSKSSMSYFPTDEGMWIRNYFNRINPETKKLEFGELSEFFILLAYAQEFYEFYDWFSKLNVENWSSEIYGIYRTFVEEFPTQIDKFLSLHKGSSNSSDFIENILERATNNIHKQEYREHFQEFLLGIAKFGRFCYENSTASEDFLANAFVSIMKMPEDTDLQTVPIGVDGFNKSILHYFRDIENMLSPIKPLFEAIGNQSNIKGKLKPVFIEAFNNFGFTHHDLKS